MIYSYTVGINVLFFYDVEEKWGCEKNESFSHPPIGESCLYILHILPVAVILLSESQVQFSLGLESVRECPEDVDQL